MHGFSLFSQAFPLSGAVFPYEKQATDVICAPRAVDSREVDDIALSHGAIG
jgi:hypothetical protein